MSHLLELVTEVIAYLGWRIWLCFIAALAIASLLVAFGIAVVWRYDIAVFVVLFGIGTGVYWEDKTWGSIEGAGRSDR